MLAPAHLLAVGVALRAGFFLFGLYQDAHMPVRYTDIDYLVFSDAAQYVYDGMLPYRRETYRYTPLLAWMLTPNAWGGLWTHFGKLLFVLCDIMTGVLIARTVPKRAKHQWVYLAIWLLNPMVITISTRGSSESVLTFIVMLAVDHLLSGNYFQLALWLGLSIHLKIYPVIYLPAFLYFLAPKGTPFVRVPVFNWLNALNVRYLAVTLASLAFWTYVMYSIYGFEFLYHSYLYHLTRLDHRHNFSLYNVSLYYGSARDAVAAWSPEKLAFLPQLALSAVLIPLALAQKNLVACLFIQTFAFVAFNKVVTSQYFIWFLIFLPHYLATSRLLLQARATAVLMLVLWVAAQASWLYFAYRLEFLGESTFDGGLLYSAVFFFLTNCWMTGQFIKYA